MYSITNDASFQEVSTLRDKLVDITEEEDHPVVLVGMSTKSEPMALNSKKAGADDCRKQVRFGR